MTTSELKSEDFLKVTLVSPHFWAFRAMGYGLGIQTWEERAIFGTAVELGLQPPSDVSSLIFRAKVVIDDRTLVLGKSDLVAAAVAAMVREVAESVSPFLLSDVEKVAARHEDGPLSCEFRGGFYDGDVMELTEEAETEFPPALMMRPEWPGMATWKRGDDLPTLDSLTRALMFNRGWVDPHTLRWAYRLMEA